MKKVVLLVMAAIVGISAGDQLSPMKGSVAHAAAGIAAEKSDNDFTAVSGSFEKNKAEFSYDMTQITADLLSAPITNTDEFKTRFAYATAQVTAKVMPMLAIRERAELAYKMAQLTARVMNDQNVDIQKAKAEFTYEVAQITAGILGYPNQGITNKRTSFAANDDTTALLRNNADIEQSRAVGTNNNNRRITETKGNIDQKTYKTLVNDFMHADSQKSQLNKVNIDGEVRYHYAFNRGYQTWDQNSSGLRTYLGANAAINDDWRAVGMFEGNKSLVNYKDDFKLSRLYATGKTGITTVTAGSFGYLMAEGNIYDNSYTGAKIDFGTPGVKYSLSLGKTDATKKTYVVAARYNDFDYNLEADVYYNQMDDTNQTIKTIWTLGGNYNFSNFNVGAMLLGSNQQDSNGKSKGYVLSINYGDFQTYRNNTYSIYAKYYNQPSGTYISHGMNGMGNSMQGFKGYGLGMRYTFAKNMVAGIEYYDLTDRVSGEKAKTWWNEINYYF